MKIVKMFWTKLENISNFFNKRKTLTQQIKPAFARGIPSEFPEKKSIISLLNQSLNHSKDEDKLRILREKLEMMKSDLRNAEIEFNAADMKFHNLSTELAKKQLALLPGKCSSMPDDVLTEYKKSIDEKYPVTEKMRDIALDDHDEKLKRVRDLQQQINDTVQLIRNSKYDSNSKIENKDLTLRPDHHDQKNVH